MRWHLQLELLSLQATRALSKARRRDGHSSDLTTAPLDKLLPLSRYHEHGTVMVTPPTSRRPLSTSPRSTCSARLTRSFRSLVGTSGLATTFWRLADQPYSPDWLVLQARRHLVDQPARFDHSIRSLVGTSGLAATFRRLADHLYSPDWLILQARRPPDHLLSPNWLTVQARRHFVDPDRLLSHR